MKHLGTTKCQCGYEFTPKDIKPPLYGKRDPHVYGGNVDRYSDTVCPSCAEGYTLWLKQTGQTWRIVTISDAPEGQQSEEVNETDEPDFDAMDKPALRKWLGAHGVEYVAQWGDKRLRELAKSI